MEVVMLPVEFREITGSQECKRMRKAGRIPAVLYGLGRESRHISLETHAFDMVLRKGARMFEFKVGDKTQMCLLKDIGFNSLGDKIVHLDFMRVDDKKPVVLNVAVEFLNPPIPVTGALLEFINRDIHISCLPREIPGALTCNIADLKVGGHVEAKDIVLPAGVTLADPPHKTLVSYHYKSIIVETPVEGAPTEPVVLTEKKPVEDAAAPEKGKDKK
ncbi:MAG: 50S ribosomal protein L25 [Planctomycetes bacterium]|nr:50S ribosomal protein L25 [Planctomycetota bacterium]